MGSLADSIITKFAAGSNSEISLKIGQYLMKLRRTKTNCQFRGPSCRINDSILVYIYGKELASDLKETDTFYEKGNEDYI